MRQRSTATDNRNSLYEPDDLTSVKKGDTLIEARPYSDTPVRCTHRTPKRVWIGSDPFDLEGKPKFVNGRGRVRLRKPVGDELKTIQAIAKERQSKADAQHAQTLATDQAAFDRVCDKVIEAAKTGERQELEEFLRAIRFAVDWSDVLGFTPV